jgi:hypothetical protein
MSFTSRMQTSKAFSDGDDPGVTSSICVNTKATACDVPFGTKNLKIVHRQAVDIIIQNAAHISQFGLHCATRFDLDRIVTLPWTTEFFGCWHGFQTPVISRLTEVYIKDFAFKMLRRNS